MFCAPRRSSDAEFSKLTERDRYNQAMDYYMTEACSTKRMADLLQIPWADMRERFNRLGVPLFFGQPRLKKRGKNPLPFKNIFPSKK